TRAFDGGPDETPFRDAAEGFVVWALGVVAMIALAAGIGLAAAGATAHIASGAAAGARDGSGSSALRPTDYFVDLMFRPRSNAGVAGGPSTNSTETVGAAAAAAQPLSPELRAEVTRIVARATAQGAL